MWIPAHGDTWCDHRSGTTINASRIQERENPIRTYIKPVEREIEPSFESWRFLTSPLNEKIFLEKNRRRQARKPHGGVKNCLFQRNVRQVTKLQHDVGVRVPLLFCSGNAGLEVFGEVEGCSNTSSIPTTSRNSKYWSFDVLGERKTGACPLPNRCVSSTLAVLKPS